MYFRYCVSVSTCFISSAFLCALSTHCENERVCLETKVLVYGTSYSTSLHTDCISSRVVLVMVGSSILISLTKNRKALLFRIRSNSSAVPLSLSGLLVASTTA